MANQSSPSNPIFELIVPREQRAAFGASTYELKEGDNVDLYRCTRHKDTCNSRLKVECEDGREIIDFYGNGLLWKHNVTTCCNWIAYHMKTAAW